MKGADAPPNAIWIDSLDLAKMVQRRQTPRAGRSLAGGGRGNPEGAPITLGGVVYPHGIGTLSINELIIDLKGQATRFVAMVGLDDAVRGQGSVNVEVWVDDKKRFAARCSRPAIRRAPVDVDLTGARFLELFIDDGGDVSTGDNADWGAALIYPQARRTDKPESWTFPSEPGPPIASERNVTDVAHQRAVHHRRHARAGRSCSAFPAACGRRWCSRRATCRRG